MGTSKRNRRKPEDGKTWQQTKSEITRTTILKAAVECFYKLGYSRTTTEKVANAAGVSRGAMLHHFPSRFDLVKATVQFIHGERIKIFEEQERLIQDNSDHSLIDEGIDAYWEQLDSPLFVVWHELGVAARTDPELHAIMRPAIKEFATNWYKVNESVFPDLVMSEEYETANYLTLYLLEGMAVSGVKRGPVADRMVPWLKTQLRAMFQDVDAINKKTTATSKTVKKGKSKS